MNAKNLKALGLKSDATNEEIDAAVSGLIALVKTAGEVSDEQKAVNAKIIQAGGALDAARAAQTIKHQAAFDASPIGKQFARAAKAKK